MSKLDHGSCTWSVVAAQGVSPAQRSGHVAVAWCPPKEDPKAAKEAADAAKEAELAAAAAAPKRPKNARRASELHAQNVMQSLEKQTAQASDVGKKPSMLLFGGSILAAPAGAAFGFFCCRLFHSHSSDSCPRGIPISVHTVH